MRILSVPGTFSLSLSVVHPEARRIIAVIKVEVAHQVRHDGAKQDQTSSHCIQHQARICKRVVVSNYEHIFVVGFGWVSGRGTGQTRASGLEEATETGGTGE